MTRWVACAMAVWATALVVTAGQGRHFYAGPLDQHPAIDYRGTPPTDVVTTLTRELSSGAATLAFDGRQGFLRALLRPAMRSTRACGRRCRVATIVT